MATNNAINSIYLPLSGGTMTGNIADNPSTKGLVGATNAPTVATGIVGERQFSTIFAAAPVSISAFTATNLTAISLTSGDWDVEGNIYFIPDTTTIPTQFIAAISTTSATLPNGAFRNSVNRTTATGKGFGLAAPTVRINVSSTTTVYIVALSGFSVSTMTMCGRILAKRAR